MTTHPTKQRGVALVVSLVLLTAVTMTALVSLQGSMLQVRMVTNSQFATSAFVAASTELEANYDEIRDNEQGLQMLSDAVSSISLSAGELVLNSDGNPEFDSVAATAVVHDYTAMGVDNQNVTSEIVYKGTGALADNSFAADSTVGTFKVYPFEINASAAVYATIASQQSMGIEYTAPSGKR